MTKNHLSKNRPDSFAEIGAYTDSYFSNTAKCVRADGDTDVVYVVFLRVPCIFAPEIAVDWLKGLADKNSFNIKIESPFKTGDIVAAGEPLLYITGSFERLVTCETFLLQKIGFACVAALQAYSACKTLPGIPFISMGARHCTGLEMQEMMDYAASIGGRVAEREVGAKGFINGASDATAGFFGQEKGMGTMPHNLIGYYGSTVAAAKAFRKHCPDKAFIVLPDFFGTEITAAIEVAKACPQEAENGTLSFRIDTHGGRYMEGLSHDESIEVLHKYAPHMLKEHWTEKQLKVLYGQGVSVAAIWHFKTALAEAGFPNVGCAGSSGFNTEKCMLMAQAKAPLTAVGTGSFIPSHFHGTFATADVIKYGTTFRVKKGRDYLVERYKKAQHKEGLFLL